MNSLQPRLNVSGILFDIDYVEELSMLIKFSPAKIIALSGLVVTLDQHWIGGLFLIVLLPAGGAAVALARWRKG
jgi:hypothetical protein